MTKNWMKIAVIFITTGIACTFCGCTLVWVDYLDGVDRRIKTDSEPSTEFKETEKIVSTPVKGLYAGKVTKSGKTVHHLQFDQALKNPQGSSRYLDIYIPSIQTRAFLERKDSYPSVTTFITESENHIAGEECACFVLNPPGYNATSTDFQDWDLLFQEGPEYLFVSYLTDFKEEQDLNSGRVGESLKIRFQNFGCPLSANAFVKVIEEGRRWMIEDQQEKYILKKGKRLLQDGIEDVMVYKNCQLKDIQSAVVVYGIVSYESEVKLIWWFYEKDKQKSWNLTGSGISSTTPDLRYVDRSKMGLVFRKCLLHAGLGGFLITVPLDIALSPFWLIACLILNNTKLRM